MIARSLLLFLALGFAPSLQAKSCSSALASPSERTWKYIQSRLRQVPLKLFREWQLVYRGYHSQNGQDRFIEQHFFLTKQDGVFVEVGAYDGLTFSNTAALEARGWTGLLIEPQFYALDRMHLTRDLDQIKIIHASVDSVEGEGVFVRANSPMLSALEDRISPSHAVRMGLSESSPRYLVPRRRLESILAEHQMSTIDYLSIDTEGNELSVLQSLDLHQVQVSVISVENNDWRNSAIEEYLKKFGYRWIARIGADEIYYRPDLVEYRP